MRIKLMLLGMIAFLFLTLHLPILAADKPPEKGGGTTGDKPPHSEKSC
jgi:hypothetical protein